MDRLASETVSMANCGEDQFKSSRGSLTVVGIGIEAISQMSLGALSHLRGADVVFYHVIDRVNLRLIIGMNPRLVDLHQFYGEDKVRRITYTQMSEVMLREVRAGKRVVAAFSGHPGIFTMATRRSVSMAKAEGFSARIIPAISSIDCALADLCVDPGVGGLQVLKAAAVLRGRLDVVTSCNLFLLQIGSVGDNRYSREGFKHNKQLDLLDKLIGLYSASHEAVYYEAATSPNAEPVITCMSLQNWRDRANTTPLESGIFYLPPAGRAYNEMVDWQREKRPATERLALDQLRDWRAEHVSERQPCSKEILDSYIENLGLGPVASLLSFSSEPTKTP